MNWLTPMGCLFGWRLQE